MFIIGCISNLDLSERNLIRQAKHNFCTIHCTTDLNLAGCSPRRKCFEPRDWSSLQLSTNENPRLKILLSGFSGSADCERRSRQHEVLRSSAVELRGALPLSKGFSSEVRSKYFCTKLKSVFFFFENVFVESAFVESIFLQKSLCQRGFPRR